VRVFLADGTLEAADALGTVCISTLQPTDLILDITGAFT
jgi:hypothetical protein